MSESIQPELNAGESAAEEKQETSRKRFAGKKKKEQKPKHVLEEALDWVNTILLALIIAVVIRGFLFEPVSVDGSSMWPTLFHQEIMLVNKWDYLWGGEPERFDVVICHYPNRGNTNFVKRVVGLPGDEIMMQGGYLYVNGERYEEPYLVNRSYADYGPVVVPEGRYFVMGDNRSNSNDSRNALVGPVTRDMILGRVSCVVYPFSHYRSILNGLEDTDEPVILAPEAHN